MSAGGPAAPAPSAEAAAREKLEQIIRACFLKTVEVILHARIVPYSLDLRRGKLNRTVRAVRLVHSRSSASARGHTHAVAALACCRPFHALRVRSNRPSLACLRAWGSVVTVCCVAYAPRLSRQFNLELDELDTVRRELGGWDPCRPLPLFIDIFLDLDSGSVVGPTQRALNEPMGEHARAQGRTASESVVLLERWQLLYLPSTQRSARARAQGPLLLRAQRTLSARSCWRCPCDSSFGRSLQLDAMVASCPSFNAHNAP